MQKYVRSKNEDYRRSSNGIITNVLLCDLDLNFQSTKIEMLISRNSQMVERNTWNKFGTSQIYIFPVANDVYYKPVKLHRNCTPGKNCISENPKWPPPY